MEIVMLSLLMAWGVMRYAGTDAIAAARGTESPRIAERRQRAAQAHERAMARLGQRGGPTIGEAFGARIADRIANPRGPRPPGPARTAIGEWWADSCGYATERRRRRHARYLAGDLGRQRAARAAKNWWHDRRSTDGGQQQRVWADAEVIRDDDPDIVDAELVDEPGTPPRPAPGTRTGPAGEPWEACPACRGSGPCEACDGDGVVPSWLFDPAVNSAADQWQALRDQPDPTEGEQPGVDLTKTTADPDPNPAAARADVFDDDAVDALNHHTDPDTDPDTDPAVLLSAEHDQHEHDHSDAGAVLASVHPIRGDIPTMATTEHTMSSGETLDPQAGLTFVTDIKDLADKIFSQLELSVATLRGRGVSGAPIALLEQMQEAAQVLVANSETAQGHFERHLATQDVVLADDTIAGTVVGTYVGTRS